MQIIFIPIKSTMRTDSTISIRANPPVNGWTFTVIVDSTSAFVGTRFIVSREPVWPYFQHKPFVAPFIPVPAMHRKRGKTLIYHRSVTSARTFPIFPLYTQGQRLLSDQRQLLFHSIVSRDVCRSTRKMSI